MARKYLFSPIGNTDPIKYLYDGSMIHICRYYQPDVVYLYLSKEMMENHKKDNRYVKTLELLGEFLHHKFEIHIIENSDMIDVQQYDIFYNEFHCWLWQHGLSTDFYPFRSQRHKRKVI